MNGCCCLLSIWELAQECKLMEHVQLNCKDMHFAVNLLRNWHWDEPSCGYEVCVVMYHQPSAPPGLGGLYMFQWNDDNCETKNNFICKYTKGGSMHQPPY